MFFNPVTMLIKFQNKGRIMLWILLLFFLMLFKPQAKVFMNFEQALNSVYPGMKVEKNNVILNELQLEKLRKEYNLDNIQSLWYPYLIYDGQEIKATVYFDKHNVRTLPEVILIAINHKSEVERVEVLSFNEPLEYMPRTKWYHQLTGMSLTNHQLSRHIHAVSGATLTVKATEKSVKKILAVHEVINSKFN